MKQWSKILLAITCIIAVIILMRFLNLGNVFQELRNWIATQGILGIIVFIAIYVITTILFMPGSALTITAGALFGSLLGIIVVIFSASIGAGIAFLLARYFLRDYIKTRFSENARFKKFEMLMEKHGSMFVAITRLVPLFPFNFLNYAFGLTNISFTKYLLWTTLCIIPGTSLYVVGTDVVIKTIQDGELPWILIGVTAVIFCFSIFIIRKIKL